MEERDAVARLKRGDISGLEALVQRYQLQAVRAANLITRDRALAEELVAAAFLRSFDRIAQFDDKRPFGPWFLRSVVNDALQAVYRAQRHVSLEANAEGMEVSLGDLLPSPEPGLSAQLEASEAREAVRDALEKLPPPQRAAIVMRYYLGMSEAEMAGELAIAPGTIKWRLHAARQRLRLLLHSLRPNGTRSKSGT